MWREQLGGDDPAEVRIPRSLDAWARYVEANPYAPRMFFFETTGDPEVAAIHDEVRRAGRRRARGDSRRRAGCRTDRRLGRRRGAGDGGGGDPPGLAGLAIWWSEHPDVPRERIVATAINAIWIGFERVRRGESWQP